MNWIKSFASVYGLYLAAFIFILLAFPKLTAIGFIAFIPLVIIGMRTGKMQFRVNWILGFFIIFYVLYAVYAIFTRHPDWAAKYMEYKLSFLLFPLIFSFLPKEKLIVKFPIYGFLAGTLYLIVAGWINSYFCSVNTVNASVACWLTTSFSYIHHPTYAAAFFTVALFLVWYSRELKIFRWSLALQLFLSFVYVLAIGMCMSFAGLLYLMLASGVFILIQIYRKWGRNYFLLSTLILPILLFLVVRYEPHLRGEYLNAKNFALEYMQDPEAFIRNKKYPMSGSEVRLVMWTAATKACVDFPAGVGTGNIDEVLSTYLRRMDQKELAALNYNPHNQYLQTSLEIGFFGLLILLGLLGSTLYLAKQNKNWLLLLVTGSLLFNMLFESMLQRQSGIVFFTFAICFLVTFSAQSLFPSRK